MNLLRKSATTIIVAVIGCLTATTSPAFAAAPTNDLFTGATSLTIGFNETIDTTEATTDSDDAQATDDCSASATDASVWYSYTAAHTSAVMFDASESDYNVQFLVGTGTQGSLTDVRCGVAMISFEAIRDTTYYILAVDDQQDQDNSNGGNLSVSFSELVQGTVGSTGTLLKRGGAVLSGTYTCDSPEVTEVEVNVDNLGQAGRRSSVNGEGAPLTITEPVCNGSAQNWSVQVTPDRGKYVAGASEAVVSFSGCIASGDVNNPGLFCGFVRVEQAVQLSRPPR
jgi:hypothetical protein